MKKIYDFTDDKEKMRDFFVLTKKEFLETYSYLTEEEYELTKKTVQNMNIREYCEKFMPSKKMPQMIDETDKEELIGQFIDIFEDFLTEKKVIIENPERDFNEKLEPEESAIIYGSDYDKLAAEIEKTLKRWRFL